MFEPSRTPQRRNFGHLPVGSITRDLYTWVFGARNLLKRLQAADILEALAIQPADRALDLGCGTGFVTVEMAKLAAHVTGVDVDPRIEQNQVPAFLADKLRFVLVTGVELPVDDGSLDVVLASEVLPMIPEPAPFLAEIRRALRPGGRVVVVNGAGHPAVERAYARDHPVLRWLRRRHPDDVPKTYEDYCRRLQEEFGTARTGFLSEADVTGALRDAGFDVVRTVHSPHAASGAALSWLQFLRVARGGSGLGNRFFVPKLLALTALDRVSRGRYPGGVICVARSPALAG